MGVKTLGLFEGYGIELEYMVAAAGTLDVAPRADELLAAEHGSITGDVEFPDISWSNELALHVIELKTSGPVATLEGLRDRFAEHVGKVARHGERLGLRLMPTAMHPWMDPHKEVRLWPHESNEVYEAMNRVFDCRGHGWGNLQSMHINLPFADDAEHTVLHAAVRLVLPLLPAIAASSPIQDGRVTGLLDNRLENYRHHCDRVPSVVGRVIPEPVGSIQEYRERILGRIFLDIEGLERTGVLLNEFMNARGAISRFVRNTIEIRVIDVQETPGADLAVAGAAIGAVRLLAEEAWSRLDEQKDVAVERLAGLFERAIVTGERTVIEDESYLRLLGWEEGAATMGEVWGHIVERIDQEHEELIGDVRQELEVILSKGCLARRIVEATGPKPDRVKLRQVYERLCDCLRDGEMFTP